MVGALSSFCRKIKIEVGAVKSSSNSILKHYKFKSFKTKIVQHLGSGEAERGLIYLISAHYHIFGNIHSCN